MKYEKSRETAPLTSIVMLSYNRWQDTQKNLESLDRHTNLPYEVIIHDNCSDQATQKFLEAVNETEHEDGNGRIKVYFGDSNLGCAGGRKEAFKRAQGEYIFSVDNDMTYSTNWLEALQETMESDSNMGAVGSRIVFPNGRVQWNGGLLNLDEDYFGSFVCVDQGKKQKAPRSRQRNCDWLPGGATLFRRSVAEQVEHSERYFNSFEDYDYSFQIVDLGYKLSSCPSSTLTHHHIRLDKKKMERERSYSDGRFNPRKDWESIIHFLERTGINMIKTSYFFDWIENDGRKPFLQWGTLNSSSNYKDHFPGRALSELSNRELRKQFDSISEQNETQRNSERIPEIGLNSEVKDLTSIVILSYNRPEALKTNLKSLAKHTSLPYEVVVFDNGSDAETQKYLDEIDGSVDEEGNGLIRVVRSPTNLGCSGGRNRAIEYATGKYIVTMDDDMTYTPEWLDSLVTRIESDPKIGAATSKVVFPTGEVQWNGGVIEQEFEGVAHFLPIDFHKDENDPSLVGEMDCDWICGGATIMKREVVQQVEHKSEDVYRNGYEDYDYALQIRAAGWRIVNCPDSVVYHHHLGHDPRSFAQQAKRNKKHAVARKNKNTLQDSLHSFLSETGIDLLAELQGSKKWHRALETALDGMPAVTRARLAREEVRRRGLPLKEGLEGTMKTREEYIATSRERIKDRYGFESLDVEALGERGIEKVLRSYQKGFAANADEFLMKQMSREIYGRIRNLTQMLKEDSPQAGRYFDLKNGVLANEGIQSIIDCVMNNSTPAVENQDWAIWWMGLIMVQNELKYLTVDICPKVTTDHARGDEKNFLDAAGRAYHTGEYETAVRIYEEVIAVAPDASEAWRNRGVALRKLGRLQEARKSVEHTLQIDANDVKAKEILEKLDATPQTKSQDKKSLEKLIQDRREKDLTETESAIHEKATVAFNSNKYESALSGYGQVIQAKPRYCWAHHDKGFALLRLKRPQEALAAFQEAYRLNPCDDVAKEQIKRINKGRIEWKKAC